MAKLQKIRPYLWFTKDAEKAAEYYRSIFKDSKIGRTAYYTEAGKDIHKQKPGSVSTVEVRLLGQDFIFLNGGPLFDFNESISFLISCDTQKEIDYYWEKLKKGGDPKAQQCGWLKDKFGLSWQVSPPILEKMMLDKNREKATRAMDAMMKMKKLNIKELKKAFKGK